MRKKSWPEAIHYNRSEKTRKRFLCRTLLWSRILSYFLFEFSSTTLSEWCALAPPREQESEHSAKTHFLGFERNFYEKVILKYNGIREI